MNEVVRRDEKDRWRQFLLSRSPRHIFLLLCIGILLFFVDSAALVAPDDFLIYQRGDRISPFALLFIFPLLLFAYWRLLATPSAILSRLRLRSILAGAVILSLPLFFLPPFVSRDAYYSLYYGQAVAAGENPYTTTIAHRFTSPYAALNDEMFYDFPTPYGPLWSVYSSIPVRLFGGDVSRSLLFLRCTGFLTIIALTALLYRIGQRSNRWGIKAAALFAWNPAVLIFVVSETHNDVFLALFFALFLIFLRRRLFVLATVALLAGGLIKWVPLLLLPLVLVVAFRELPRKKALQTSIVVGALSAFVLFMSFFPYWDGQNVFRGIMKQGALFNYTYFIAQGAFFFGTANNVGVLLNHSYNVFTILNVTILRSIGILLFLGTALLVLRQYLRRRLEMDETAYTLLLLFALLSISWLMLWYILWFFPLAASSPRLLKLTAVVSMYFFAALFVPVIIVLPMYILFVLAYSLAKKYFKSPSSPQGPMLQQQSDEHAG